MTGRLILVVGPSGAGKDTLMSAAAEHLQRDERFVFPRRLVTRQAVAELEDHDSLSIAEFNRLVTAGEFTLAWEAHGLGYIIPANVAAEVRLGRIAVCNGSRQIVQNALRQYPHSAVIAITADKEVRALRLLARGRENQAEIEERLAREVEPLPPSDRIIVTDNSGTLEQGIDDFVGALRRAAELQTA